ncbi:hypothetical protein D8803_01110 [Streptococcus oralis]|uniref:Uncharacterized protein n=1 Tax=Streptococcus oralis TaxID=1303 RepID=A0A3R9M4E1_STROR|nr:MULTISPECIES: hypothetical protein [Streptococcus]RSJ02814.1 hypothetical protein D8840_05675 [Streptococcus mitis]RSJ66180.1 hypothetical protein D8803_01110 [Streptococcus oralis]
MAFFILVIAIAGGIFWFNRKSAIDKYTKKQELAMKILEKSKRIRLEVMADINELGGRMASADREQYISLTQERESLQETLETIEASIRAMESILQWRVDSSGGRLEIDKELLNLRRYSGLTLEELAQDCGIVL